MSLIQYEPFVSEPESPSDKPLEKMSIRQLRDERRIAILLEMWDRLKHIDDRLYNLGVYPS